MLRPDFSDIQKNGFRICQFRIFFTPEMRTRKFSRSKEGYVESGDILSEKRIVLQYLIQKSEINFTIYYFSKQLTYLFITTTLILLVYHNTVIALPIITALFSLIFYIITYRKQVDFVMGDVGIKFAECIYNARIKEKYNF
jgi:hypothetical protein